MEEDNVDEVDDDEGDVTNKIAELAVSDKINVEYVWKDALDKVLLLVEELVVALVCKIVLTVIKSVGEGPVLEVLGLDISPSAPGM